MSDVVNDRPTVEKATVSAPPDYSKIYEAVWRNMERENTLMNYRNQWSIVLSGGILATQGVLLTALKDFERDKVDHLFSGSVLALMFFLSCLAVFFCLKTNEGVQAAQNQLEYLKGHYEQFRAGECSGNLFEATLRYPRPFGDPHDHNKGNAAALVFPKVMLTIWAVFALIEGASASIMIADGLRRDLHETKLPAQPPSPADSSSTLRNPSGAMTPHSNK
ncbi:MULTISPECIES: hypothetical protein [Methylosinus]|uniref:Uncharacterized protein n=1 Tax=Methylosinus trichosporium (strain ATCC 35070 / NCIMB 11131 / UNIQEM 75 / OB3b) TaxID=595536 RepID=A0A2D2D1X1_METT3|nr:MULTISPECIES: hypothetical protein [Methylosinus]ATQ69005.1 hypothetical protein CQW49_14810 [Methylosinus trichosporium OB3b]